jgi:hypothetical protein
MSEPASYVFHTTVTEVVEDFDEVATKLSKPENIEGGQRHYGMEKRSRGWFILIKDLGLRIWISEAEPLDVKKGSKVELRIIP